MSQGSGQDVPVWAAWATILVAIALCTYALRMTFQWFAAASG